MLRSATTLMLLATLGVVSSMGAKSTWELLGSRQVTERLDHDEILLRTGAGVLRQVKLSVQRAPIDMQRVVVHFTEGLDQRSDMQMTIPADGESRAIDIAGKGRAVRSVEFWYDATTLRGRRAQVRLFGMR
jgi:hypothetical protein